MFKGQRLHKISNHFISLAMPLTYAVNLTELRFTYGTVVKIASTNMRRTAMDDFIQENILLFKKIIFL